MAFFAKLLSRNQGKTASATPGMIEVRSSLSPSTSASASLEKIEWNIRRFSSALSTATSKEKKEYFRKNLEYWKIQKLAEELRPTEG